MKIKLWLGFVKSPSKLELAYLILTTPLSFSFGEVWLGHWRGENVAVKIFTNTTIVMYKAMLIG